ncbi:hypothetical protein K144313037_p10410 (plasmid) [Clostridium tetani]|uniref:hypothetical protein n=2 Tax=Clostridium tetani TaxID=1513 RepID=UPI000D2086CB|nr:hypothetical protein [Clostridium tetani]AVP55921.1 hypothetical protein C3B72_12565 [Clostridium tetani]RXI78816.1 hypothetical protein DP128_00115 [Clostridium tetani]WFN63276.1 hypothetical protein PAA20_13600 [Clostridium tetani]SUY80144.1 Uncharacterised protein [Clostridium tetani]BDR71174.1 hypothetical protein K144313037_p10410 [Clostridium tetani]
MHKINSYFKLFFKFLLLYSIATILTLIIISIILTDNELNYNSLKYFIVSFVIMAVINAFQYMDTEKIIPIMDTLHLKTALKNMKWEMKQENNIIIIKPRFLDSLFGEKIFIKTYNDDKVKIIGAKRLVSRLINYVNFIS